MMLLLLQVVAAGQNARQLLEKGWAELVRDNDTTALKYFGQAYNKASSHGQVEETAQALLYMGICEYSVSYSNGLSYCFKAMDEYKKLESSAPAKAMEGRARCLQLVATIKSRQGQYRESVSLSKEAMQSFSEGRDTTGYLGMIYNNLGNDYKQLKLDDSSVYFHRLALEEHLRARNYTYLPIAYIKIAEIEVAANNKEKSLKLYERALQIADSTGNRQAQVSAWIGMGEWYWAFGRDFLQTEKAYLKAERIAATLTDKLFSAMTAKHLLALYKDCGDFRHALIYQQIVTELRDSIYAWDRRKEIKTLEIQFDLAEKDREVRLAKKEKEVTTLTNYMLWGGIMILLLLSGVVIFILRRNNKRDKLLLQAREALVKAMQEQKLLKDQQMQRELEYKESQLSAMTLQMLQKNELMLELKERLEQDNASVSDPMLNKIISKGLNHDKEWSDFNTYFESINTSFYTRLKQAYPDISQNDLKVCALIKLDLSIKEMADILNISPDSVKTARYRLRKKLRLNTEDNLADFIRDLS